MRKRYRDYEQFRREVLRGHSGPMASAAEEVADEIYHQDYNDDLESLWDSYDGEEE